MSSSPCDVGVIEVGDVPVNNVDHMDAVVLVLVYMGWASLSKTTWAMCPPSSLSMWPSVIIFVENVGDVPVVLVVDMAGHCCHHCCRRG